MKPVYNSNGSLPSWTTRSSFRAAVELMLLYGSAAWTLTKKLENMLDRTYTRMLRPVLNKSWKQYPNKEELYGKIPPISSMV